MEKRDIANEILNERLIKSIQPIFTADEIEVERFYQPYVKVYLVFTMDGLKQIYEMAHCKAATDKSFEEYISTHDKFVVTAYSFLNGSSKLYVDLPEHPDFPGEVMLSGEWTDSFDALLEKKLGMPKDEYIASKLNDTKLAIDTKIVKSMNMGNEAPDEITNSSKNTLGRIAKTQLGMTLTEKIKEIELPVPSDYTVDFGTDKIVDILVDNNNMPQEITFNVSEKDLETLIYRSSAEQFLEYTGDLKEFNERGRKADIIAHFTDNKTVVEMSGEQFLKPIKVPATRHEKDQIRDTALEYIKQHDAKWQKPGKTNKNKPTQIGK